MADSRIRLQPRSAALFVEREIYVGWDDVLQTYYAHVIDGADEQGEERRTFEVGGDLGEVTDPSRLVAAVGPYAEVPDNLGELLNISRVSRTTTDTDLRGESRSYQNQMHFEERIGELYRPNGFVTGLGRDDVLPVLTWQNWDLTGVQAVEGGYAETYRRGDHEAVLHRDQPDSNRLGERLLSPVLVDGERHGAHSVRALERALSESTEDRLDDPGPRMTAPLDQLPIAEAVSRDGALSGDLMPEPAEARAADDLLDQLFLEDPLDDDEGFHFGLGT
ncbi:hypothetical protein AB0878_44985 [Amycolatopsis sp. NPDC047767]|uniref:hypothetical protein n=1 Tax=Amycolatopsis sp. NPDC047767 TaxID=3156765 RepID=UPI00345363B0